jgi:hypothetical protein
MEHETGVRAIPQNGTANQLHTLISLADFKAVLGIDDREETLSRYYLLTATYTIEQYCKRRLLRKKRFEFVPFYGDYLLGADNFYCGDNFFGPTPYGLIGKTGSPVRLPSWASCGTIRFGRFWRSTRPAP